MGPCPEVVELSSEQVRRRVAGAPSATKYEEAQQLAAEELPVLRSLVRNKPKTPALWLTSKERNWLYAFDALTLAVATSPQR